MNGVDEYFIQWKDASNTHNSWVPYNELSHSKSKIEEYETLINSMIQKELEQESAIQAKKIKQTKNSGKPKAVTIKARRASSSQNIKHKGKCRKPKAVVEPKIIDIAQPIEIIKVKFDSSANMSLVVKWSDGQNRNMPYCDFRKSYPQELISFFESKLVFPFENEGTKKFFLNNSYPKINN